MTHDLRDSLAELADADAAAAPPSTIDITRARIDGRRRMLAARSAPIGAGLAVVAVCGLALTSLGATGGDGSRPAAATTTGGSQTTAVLHGTDPLVIAADFGWLPDGWQTVSRADGPEGITSIARGPGDAPNGKSPAPNVYMTVTKTEPQLSENESKKPATVSGTKQAYFKIAATTADNTAPEPRLIWQTADGRWVELVSIGIDGSVTAKEALFVRMADGVALTQRAQPLPIHIERLPNLIVTRAQYDSPPAFMGAGGGWTAELTLGYTAAQQMSGMVGITVEPVGQDEFAAAAHHPVDPATGKVKMDPSPAPMTNRQDPGVCREMDGLEVCVIPPDPTTPRGQKLTDPLQPLGGAQGLLDKIISLGPDPANWTTAVVN